MKVASPSRVAFRYLLARNDREKIRKAEELYHKAYQALEGQQGLLTYPSKGKTYLFGKNFGRPGLTILFERKSTQTTHRETPKGDLIVVGTGGLEPIQAMERHKRLIMHELVHSLDEEQMGRGWGQATKSYVAPDINFEAYANHPLELNAYFLETLAILAEPVDKALSEITPDKPGDGKHQTAVWNLDDWLRDYGKNYQVLRKRFWIVLNKKVRPTLTEKNQRRFDKRLYDWWYKVSRKANKVMQDLLDRQDEMAVMVRTASYYRLHPQTPLVEVIQRWTEGDSATDGSMPVYYSVHELSPFKEYQWTRDNSRDGYARVGGQGVWLKGPMKWDAIKEDMRKKGWDSKEPLHFQIGKDGSAKIGEGNHRLAIAEAIGLHKVPVMFHFLRDKVVKGLVQEEATVSTMALTNVVQETLDRAKKNGPLSPKEKSQVDGIMRLLGL